MIYNCIWYKKPEPVIRYGIPAFCLMGNDIYLRNRIYFQSQV